MGKHISWAWDERDGLWHRVLPVITRRHRSLCRHFGHPRVIIGSVYSAGERIEREQCERCGALVSSRRHLPPEAVEGR